MDFHITNHLYLSYLLWIGVAFSLYPFYGNDKDDEDDEDDDMELYFFFEFEFSFHGFDWLMHNCMRFCDGTPGTLSHSQRLLVLLQILMGSAGKCRNEKQIIFNFHVLFEIKSLIKEEQII